MGICTPWHAGAPLAGRYPARDMTSVDILLYIQRLWKDGYREFPNLQGMTPAQVLARLSEKDARYQMGEERLREVLGEMR